MRRNRAWRALTTAFVVLAAAVLMVVAPGSASAAPDCNSFTSYSSVGGYMRVPTIGRETGAYNCELGRGNYGDAVRVLQASLNRCFWQNVAVDGDFGPKTQQALRNAQMMMNSWYDPDIAVDGRYGPQTRRGGFAFAVFTSYGGWQVKQDGYCYYKIDP